MSFRGCKDDCLSRTQCTSVNYYKRQGLCQLISAHTREPIGRPGWMYSNRSTWNQGHYSQCSCEDTEKCEVVDDDTVLCKTVRCNNPVHEFEELDFVGNIYSLGGIVYASCDNTTLVATQRARMICTSTGRWSWLDPPINCDEGIEVFRGLEYKNGIYQSFIYEGHESSDTNTACLQTPIPYDCTRHYRSPLIDNWENLGVSQVLFSVVKDGEAVQYVLFDGFNSTMESWFSADRVIESSWVDLPTNKSVTIRLRGKVGRFDEGHFSCSLTRRFVMIDEKATLSNCSTDKGWFMATRADFNKACCIYDVSEKTKLLYSKLNTSVNFNSYKDVGYADFVSITVFTGIDIH